MAVVGEDEIGGESWSRIPVVRHENQRHSAQVTKEIRERDFLLMKCVVSRGGWCEKEKRGIKIPSFLSFLITIESERSSSSSFSIRRRGFDQIAGRSAFLAEKQFRAPRPT